MARELPLDNPAARTLLEACKAEAKPKYVAAALLSRQEASIRIAESLFDVCKLGPEERPKVHGARERLHSLLCGIHYQWDEGEETWLWRNKLEKYLNEWGGDHHLLLIDRMSTIGQSRGLVKALDAEESVARWRDEWQQAYEERCKSIERLTHMRAADLWAGSDEQRRNVLDAVEAANEVLSDEDVAQLAQAGAW